MKQILLTPCFNLNNRDCLNMTKENQCWFRKCKFKIADVNYFSKAVICETFPLFLLCPTKHNFSSPTKTSIGSTNNTSPCIWNCRFFWDKSETLNEFWNVDTKHTLRIIQKKIKSQVQIISPITMWCYTKNECCVLQLFFTKMFSPYTDGLSVYSYTTTPTSQNFLYHLLKIYLFLYSNFIFSLPAIEPSYK